MRIAFHDMKFLHNDTNDLSGINLGYDYCAEHEWGIDRLNKFFGINIKEDIYGIEKRKITKLPDQFGYEKNKKFTFLYCSYCKDYDFEECFNNQKWMKTNFITGWDSGSFCVYTNYDMQELIDAFYNLDIAMGIGKAVNPFANGGLIFTIISKMSELEKELMYQEDKAYHELNLEAKATGIYELLAEKKKEYYCLEPSRNKDGSISWWVNPVEQTKYNTTWCSLEDLKDWSEDKGAIVKC